MSQRFSVVDVETANADLGSICQIGIATFDGDSLVSEWQSLVDPRDEFDGMNISIHGIDAAAVAGKPDFGQLVNEVRLRLLDGITVSYGPFDRVALDRAFGRCGADLPATWLDCTRVVRRAWQHMAYRGYGLRNACAHIGHSFQHHDALQDARAAGYVLLAAMRETGMDLATWQARAAGPLQPGQGGSIQADGNPEGALYGEVMVFTGALQMSRRDAADAAARVGCTVEPNVTKRTSMLVVGDQDIIKLAGHEKSTKHRKAEELAAGGQPIRFLCESDFLRLVRLTGSVTA